MERKRAGQFAVAANLTIHGVTREVIFDVERQRPPGKDPWRDARIGYSAAAKINRKYFGLTWSAAGGFLLSDEVTITLSVEFVRA